MRSVYCFEPAGSGGGSQVSLRLLVRHLDPARYRATVVLGCPLGHWPVQTLVLKIRGLHNYDFFPAAWSVAWVYHVLLWGMCLPGDFWKAFRFLRRHRPDLVHINGGQLLAVGLAAQAAGCRVIWHVRELIPPNRVSRLQHAVYRRCATCILTVSRAVERRLSPGAVPVVTVPNPVDLESPLPLDPEPEAGPLRVLLLGRPSRAKGFLFLARVADRLRDRTDIRFVVAGEMADTDHGAMHALLRRAYRRLTGRCGRIEEIRAAWSPLVQAGLGELPGTVDANVAMGRCDLVVCPNEVGESFGRTVIEAYAQGRPVIAAAIEPFDETVISGETGWLLPLDPDAWAEKLVFLAGHREILAGMRDRVRQAAAPYAASRHADAVMAWYDAAMAAGPSGEGGA